MTLNTAGSYLGSGISVVENRHPGVLRQTSRKAPSCVCVVVFSAARISLLKHKSFVASLLEILKGFP